jgi:PAS domain S-box-containing protein
METEPISAGQSPDLSALCLDLMDHSPAPMAIVEGATHIVRYVNLAFCRLMKAARELLLGRPFGELLPAQNGCVTMLDRVFRTGNPESHTEEQQSEPHPVVWSYMMWPLLGEEPRVGLMLQVTEATHSHETMLAINEALMLASLRQHELAEAAEASNSELQKVISEHKRAEEALRVSEQRFRALFELGPVGVYSCDASGVIQEYNRRAAELWGRTPALGETDEKFCGSWKLFRPNGSFMPYEQCPMADVLRGKIPWVRDAEVLIERPDGSRSTVIVNIRSLNQGGGQLTGAINCFYDISERRRLEDSLVARAEELARADRSKDEFLAMLAHELRNPLAPVCNAAEILRAANASEEERSEAQRIIARQIENMSRMIDDLLDVSRITKGKIELRRKPVALEAILIAATNVARPAMTSRSQELMVSLPTEPVFLNADATRLEQVFNNLLGNACKYSADGCHIELSAERATGIEPPEVIVRVLDDGSGIAPEMLPRVFELFAQASRTLDRTQGGLGIGLTLVQRLVHLHGGSVEAHSDGLGCGSEFIVHLPMLREAPPPLPLQPAHASRQTRHRILIVDDSIDAARTLAILQRRWGHETRTASTGPGALAIAADFLPDVVLLDIGLPGMDGFEVARKLRCMPTLARVAIVAMTGYGTDQDRAMGKDAGFDEYLVKPLDLTRLREWIGNRK